MEEKLLQETLAKLYFMVKKIDERTSKLEDNISYLTESVDLLIRIQTELLQKKVKYSNPK
jgi:exonuclease VII small subunit